MPVKDLLSSRLGLVVKSPKMNVKMSVCRCLFGMPDHEELKRELDAQLKQANVDMKRTWNFDPTFDQPLEGRFEWTLPEKDEYVPAFYSKGYKPSKFTRRALMPEIDTKYSNITPPSSPEPILTVPVIARLSAETVSDTEADLLEIRRENETTPEARVVRQPKIEGK